MKLFIDRDFFDSPNPPVIYLCNTSKRIIGELPAANRNGNFKWNSYSEISFEIPRLYVDVLTGETKIHPLYDKVEAPRNVLLKGYGYFSIQDIDDTSGDMDTKSVSCFSAEYATSNKYLNSFHINTGEVDSVEVLYNESQYGVNYNTDQDSFYQLASGEFDPYESYYKKSQTEDSYIYEQIQISNQDEYNGYINNTSDNEYEKLYIKKFPNVQFYNGNSSKRGLSLLHLVFDNIPEWKIGNVDQSLWRKERKFSEDRISVYDFLMNNVAETFGCTFVWDSLTGLVNVYEEVDDDEMENEASSRFETDVYISKDNLASECKVSYSSDNIKTKLVVTGSDDLDIREVNLGRNEIMDLSFYHTFDWMEQDLFEAYDDYLEALQEAETGINKYGYKSTIYPMSYSDATKGWVAANNRWSDLMNAVPADGNVVLVGDEFKKLYCTYNSINNAYYQSTINSGTQYVEPSKLFLDEKYTRPIPEPTNSEMYVVQGYHLVYDKSQKKFKVEDEWKSNEIALIKQLNLYHVDKDIDANKQDNILLKLKNSSSDIATIRIYDRRKEANEYDERFRYYTRNSEGKFSEVPIVFSNATDFNSKKEEFSKDGTTIWTNDYYIQSIVVKASNGASEAPDEYPISEWIKNELTAEAMNLKEYTVTYIGTMGAYFVLAKDETVPENLQDYGVRLLEEKHKTYTTIFQTQTEAMLSQEKAQCIVQDEEPEGDYKEGTRWLDTNSSPVVLKEYDGNNWKIISETVPEADRQDYENYQRYIDNYNKLSTVQKVLFEKEREAEYSLNGYSVPDRVIVLSPTDGSSLDENMYNAALAHFDGYTVTGKSLDANLPLYTFTTSFDPSGRVFAVYLKGTTPYVSYANSQGVYQMIRDYIRDKTEMNKFFTEDQWIRLSPFIKEDEFNDSNFLLTGYESEEERIKICQELMDAADKELKTLCKPSLEFSMTMANILALPEFESLFDQFQLGNFIKVGIRDGYVKRSRLLEVSMNFDNLNDFSCTFGNLVTTKSEVDRHADLLSQAVSAGKQVAKSSGAWQKSVDKTNWLEDSLTNGLSDLTLAVGSASGQAISWDSTGMHFRKYRNGSTTEFEPEEMAIINNALVATNDSWRTSKSAFGKYTINGEERWGTIAEYVTSDTLEGKLIRGGAIEIGSGDTKFIVNEDGSVQIKSGGTDYMNAMTAIDNAYRFNTVLVYSGLTVFSDTSHTCTVTCDVYDYKKIITDEVIADGGTFIWKRVSNSATADSEWKPTYIDGKPNQIIISVDDIEKNSQFYCEVDFDETKFTNENEETGIIE
jgi:hypothetical protein